MANPTLDYAHPLHTFATTDPNDGGTYGLTFTASKECYIFGDLWANGYCYLSINGIQYAVGGYSNGVQTSNCVCIKIKAGDVVSVSIASTLLHILDVAD